MTRIRIKFPDGKVFAELDEHTSIMVRAYALISNKTVEEVINEFMIEFAKGIKNGTIDPKTGENIASDRSTGKASSHH